MEVERDRREGLRLWPPRPLSERDVASEMMQYERGWVCVDWTHRAQDIQKESGVQPIRHLTLWLPVVTYCRVKSGNKVTSLLISILYRVFVLDFLESGTAGHDKSCRFFKKFQSIIYVGNNFIWKAQMASLPDDEAKNVFLCRGWEVTTVYRYIYIYVTLLTYERWPSTVSTRV